MAVLTRVLSALALVAAARGAEDASAADVPYAPPSTPLPGAIFYDPFSAPTVGELEQWTVSADEEFDGDWAIKEFSKPQGLPGDTGLVVSSKAKRHAIATVLPTPFAPAGVGLVLQYELQLQNGLECGGAYLKLLRASEDLSSSGFKASTPYTIMFGPDKCGSTNKVHFILQHKPPSCDECSFEEKHLVATPVPIGDKKTHLYTAVVTADNLVKIYIDHKEVASASLLEDADFAPPLNPPKMIDDPKDLKPTDWVDDPKMADLSSVKPDDWDDDAPKRIEDAAASKPEAWLEDEPLEVPDPAVSAPTDWDEDEDGEWEPPMIANPACKSAGCGNWKPPMIDNPAYKGKWVQQKIDNPEYIGVWNPVQIDNPAYVTKHDPAPHAMAPIGGVGIELWTMQDGILFDNILITSDLKIAQELAANTFDKRVAAEKEAAKRPQIERKPGFLGSVEYYVSHGVFFAMGHKLEVLCALLLGLLPILFLCCRSSPQKARGLPSVEEPSEVEEEAEGEAEGAADAPAKEEEMPVVEAVPAPKAPSGKKGRTKRAD